MGRLGYYSKLSGQAPQESDLPPKNFAHRVPYWSLHMHASLEEIKLGLLFILVDWHLIQKGNKSPLVVS